MAETMTLKQFSENLQTLVNTDENVAALTMPIDFQDVSADTLQIVNEYESYLTNNDYENAYNLRKNNPVLETLILDATKLNYLQTLMLTSYEFAKNEKTAANTSYDAVKSQLKDENGELITNVQDAIDVLNTNVNSTVQTELDKINETLDNTVEKIELDVKESLSNIDQTVAIRFNETTETVQIYKDGTWQDWLTTGHDGIIVVSQAQTILNKTDTSLGTEITGGWSPSPVFTVDAHMSGSNYTNTKTATAETTNSISLNSIKHIDIYYSFTYSGNEAYKVTTTSAYVELYATNENGEVVVSTKVTNKEKGFGSYSLALSTADIIGMHKIGYKIRSYCKEYTDSGYDPDTGTNDSWGVTQNIKANVSKILLYTM